MTPNRLPLVMFAATGLVIAAIVGFATESWIVFFIAVAIHAIASVVVIGGSLKATTTGPETDPHSEQLERKADAATGDGPRNVETELEALKNQPPSR